MKFSVLCILIILRYAFIINILKLKPWIGNINDQIKPKWLN